MVWCGVVELILVSGGRVVDEVQRGGDVIGLEGSHSLGEKSCFSALSIVIDSDIQVEVLY